MVSGLVSVAATILVAAIHQTYGPGAPPKAAQCRSQVKQLLQAMSMYALDNEGRLPQAERWMDQTLAYTKSDGLYRCPEMWRERGFGYAMNTQLSAVVTASVEEPQARPLVYDSTNLSWNARDALASLPAPKRHRQGNFVGFLDGHVEPIEPAKLPE